MNRVVRSLCLASLGVSLICISGCGGPADNLAAEDKIHQADQDLLHNQIDAALTDSSAAAAMTDISPDIAAEAQLRLGQSNLSHARQLMTQAQDVELNVDRLLNELHLSIAAVNAAQAQMQADAGLDPSATVTVLQQRITEAQGAGDQNWPTPPSSDQPSQPGDSGLLSLAGLVAQISRLQGEISDNHDKTQQITNARISVLDQSDTFQQKSLSDTGEQSVSDVASAADLRRQAALMAIQLDKLTAAEVQLQADLANYQVQHTGVQQVLADYQKQIDDLNLAWTSTQQDIAKQKESIAALAGPGQSASAPSSDLPMSSTIADEFTDLKRLVSSSRDLRTQAASALTSASNAFRSAGQSGEQLSQQFSSLSFSPHVTPAETTDVREINETYNGATAKLHQAEAQSELVINNSVEAMIAVAVKGTAQAAQTALGDDTPASVADCLNSVSSPSIEDLTASAEQPLTQSMQLFDEENMQVLGRPSRRIAKDDGLIRQDDRRIRRQRIVPGPVRKARRRPNSQGFPDGHQCPGQSGGSAIPPRYLQSPTRSRQHPPRNNNRAITQRKCPCMAMHGLFVRRIILTPSSAKPPSQTRQTQCNNTQTG